MKDSFPYFLGMNNMYFCVTLMMAIFINQATSIRYQSDYGKQKLVIPRGSDSSKRPEAVFPIMKKVFGLLSYSRPVLKNSFFKLARSDNHGERFDGPRPLRWG